MTAATSGPPEPENTLQRRVFDRRERERTRKTLEALGHQKTSPLRAIRAKCLDCTGQHPSVVRTCEIPECSLWPFRMAWNPWLPARPNASPSRSEQCGEGDA